MLFLSVHSNIKTVSAPYTVSNEETSDYTGDGSVVNVEDIEDEEEAYSEVNQYHEDAENKASAFWLVISIVTHSKWNFGVYIFGLEAVGDSLIRFCNFNNLKKIWFKS